MHPNECLERIGELLKEVDLELRARNKSSLIRKYKIHRDNLFVNEENKDLIKLCDFIIKDLEDLCEI